MAYIWHIDSKLSYIHTYCTYIKSVCKAHKELLCTTVSAISNTKQVPFLFLLRNQKCVSTDVCCRVHKLLVSYYICTILCHWLAIAQSFIESTALTDFCRCQFLFKSPGHWASCAEGEAFCVKWTRHVYCLMVLVSLNQSSCCSTGEISEQCFHPVIITYSPHASYPSSLDF